MPVSSNWKIDYDLGGGSARSVVAFGQLIAEEMQLPWGQQVQGNERLRAASMQYFGRGNVVRGVQITTFKDFSSVTAAMNWGLDFSCNLPSLEKKTVTIEVSGGDKYTLADATIQSAPVSFVTDKSAVARLAIAWAITGGTLTKI